MGDINNRLFGECFEIIVGTNEEYILAFNIKYAKDGHFTLNSAFASHSHCSGIRKLTICGPHIVSGGVDEMVHVFNLKKRNKIGVIGEHEGTITDLQQHKQKYVFSASEDGKICIFLEGKWECEKKLIGHKGTINSVAVHPTGRLAISVGQDRTLHTWDLIKGRKAYVSNLHEVGSIVKWSPSGEEYVVVVDSRVDLHAVQSAHTASYSHDFFVRINDIAFLQEKVLLVALENGRVAVHDLAAGATLQAWEAHSNRVRAMDLMPPAAPHTHPRYYLVTGSSDGWKDDLSEPAECVSAKDTQCRITCLVVYTDAHYKEAVKSRTLDQVNVKVNRMMLRGKRTKSKTKRVKRRADDDDDDDEIDETEFKEKVKVEYVPVPVPKKKKRVTIVEDEEEEDDEEDEEHIDSQVEVYTGYQALKMMGLAKEEKETEGTSVRKNRGKVPKRFTE
ncbi:p21-activated protein kinase-interacting protein 1-like [Hyalella azteca]|uniref:P21-activated protein kinase-interacting protein 1-like n=1 Tax=Hyalella azteca TaxID=294128 RepID=A0A8B7NHG0_HYAAZ|nr:p21-activated protein kinase-interacting protein 1-like [Hyalella azteca]